MESKTTVVICLIPKNKCCTSSITDTYTHALTSCSTGMTVLVVLNQRLPHLNAEFKEQQEEITKSY